MSQINQNGERRATRRGRYVLATAAVLSLYLLIARHTIEAYAAIGSGFSFTPESKDLLYDLLLLPQLCMLCAVATIVYIVTVKSAGPAAKLFWALVLLVALMSWPASCATGALLTDTDTGTDHSTGSWF